MSDETPSESMQRVAAADMAARQAEARAKCRRGVHSYVGRSYVQVSATHYVKVCWACGQQDRCEGQAPEES